jgi:sec-independent protein translocase protein TatB
MGMPPTIQMANLGMADSLIILVIALVVFGPRKLPQIGRQIGKLMYEFRKASNDFKFQMEEELRISEDADRRKQEEERLKALALAAPKPEAAPALPAAPASTIDATVASTPPTAPRYETGDLFESLAPPVEVLPFESAVEETHPRIQPPSTGEQVAAARPNSVIAVDDSVTAFEEPIPAPPGQAVHHG